MKYSNSTIDDTILYSFFVIRRLLAMNGFNVEKSELILWKMAWNLGDPSFWPIKPMAERKSDSQLLYNRAPKRAQHQWSAWRVF